MDECAGARRVSGLVAALEISPPSKCRCRVQRLEIKSRRGEISRKYGILVVLAFVPLLSSPSLVAIARGNSMHCL